MVEVDLRGRKRRGRYNPTSELDLHLRILTRRPDVGAIVHAHPPVATGLAVAGQDLHILVLPELILQCGDVPRSEEHTSELQSQSNIVCRLLLAKKKTIKYSTQLT